MFRLMCLEMSTGPLVLLYRVEGDGYGLDPHFFEGPVTVYEKMAIMFLLLMFTVARLSLEPPPLILYRFVME